MKRVFVCSPYSGNTHANVLYARLCIRDCLVRGEAPFAPHLLYPQPHVLDDKDERQREYGITAGMQFLAVSELLVVYKDLGISAGMSIEIQHAIRIGKAIEYRELVPMRDFVEA